MKEEMFSVNIGTVDRIEFDFDYTDMDKTFTFDLGHTVASDGQTSLTMIKYLEGNLGIGVDPFKEFYLHLVTVYYAGEYAGEVPISEIVEGRCVLSMRVTLMGAGNSTDGAVYTYRFYPYSDRRVLVSLQRDDGDVGAYFYVTASDVEKIYNDISLLLQGKTPDPEKQS